ncbi:MAG: hypothetical protein CBE50_001965 [Flammeovirgaceae bacterium TMED290]|nr:MAG: hypothetical protein CBE50_001965 [Flammeovirgaceae bacterium TMED290]|tara:strand:+ start:381 stop:938 length:558 start_codon:yes stop_codon:yes gene_type:complete
MISNKNNFYFVLGLILIASFARIIPHYPNFTPLCAIALFGGKYFNNKYLAYLLPLLALWLSDILINNFILGNYFDGFILFYSGFYWQYGSFILITLIGRKTLKNFSFLKLLGTSVFSSLLFFIISNFGVWISSSLYSKDIFGLFACYVAAIPFFIGTLSGAIFYSFFLFGSYEFLSRKLSKITSN